MDYYEQLQQEEMQESLRQHLRSLNVMEELVFAHRNYTTYELEFRGNPPKVLRNLNAIRGQYEPQDWNPAFLNTLASYTHPKLTAILLRATGLSPTS